MGYVIFAENLKRVQKKNGVQEKTSYAKVVIREYWRWRSKIIREN